MGTEPAATSDAEEEESREGHGAGEAGGLLQLEPARLPQGTNNQCDPNEPLSSSKGWGVGVGRVQENSMPAIFNWAQLGFSGGWLES